MDRLVPLDMSLFGQFIAGDQFQLMTFAGLRSYSQHGDIERTEVVTVPGYPTKLLIVHVQKAFFVESGAWSPSPLTEFSERLENLSMGEGDGEGYLLVYDKRGQMLFGLVKQDHPMAMKPQDRATFLAHSPRRACA